MRLGDLDALKKQIKNDYCKNHCPLPDAEYYCPSNCSVRYFIKIIDSAPPVVNEYTKGFADGERSGRHFPLTDEEKAILVSQWQPQGEWDKWIIAEIQCPNCFEYFETDCYSTGELNKCPNCGASMKGSVEE